MDGLSAVGLHPMGCATGENVVDDRPRVLPARIVGRHDHTVGMGQRGVEHQRPLAPVAIAPAAEDDPEQAAGDGTKGGQDCRQRRRRVGVVHEDVDTVTADRLEPAGGQGQPAETSGDVVGEKSESAGGGEGGGGVDGVVPTEGGNGDRVQIGRAHV